jgi:hypothetical protein
LSIELIPAYFPDSFSVSEIFVYASINAFYTTFCWDSLIYRDQRKYISGCNISNILIFTPWVFLNFSGLIHILTKKFSIILSLLGGLVLTIASIWPLADIELFVQFIIDVIFGQIALFGLMLFTLVTGLIAINFISPFHPNFMIRKAFHALAFFLFLPPLVFSKFDKPRLIIFAFNCVSVALILVEVMRYSGKVFN